MKVKADIRDLMDGLDEENYKDLELGQADSFDTGRIRQLALEKLHSKGSIEEKESKKTMKRAPYRILVAVAIIAVLTTTAFAAGGLDFFRTMFGNSVDNAGSSIQHMAVSVKDDDFEMAAEQLISDGYSTKMIVSLSPLSKEARGWLEKANAIDIKTEVVGGSENAEDTDMVMMGSERLTEFDTEDKAYFCVTYENNRSYAGQSLQLTLTALRAISHTENKETMIAESNLALTIENPKSMTAQRTILFPVPGASEENSYPVDLTVNSISAVLTIQEPAGSTSTPTMDVTLVMKDGTKEAVFEAGWVAEGAGGGGGVALSDNQNALPLASGHSYMRDMETSRILQTASFSRIINPADADYVLVDETRYDFNK